MEPFRNTGIKYLTHTKDKSMLVSSPALQSRVKWEMTFSDACGCSSGATKQSDDTAVARVLSETARQVLSLRPDGWCSRK
jgi:hypothetical protein